MNRFAIIVLAAFLAAPPAGLRADGAREAFDSTYAPEMQKVKSTSDPADDMALAGKLVAEARKAQDRPELAALMCEEAASLCEARPEASDQAAEALELLAQIAPQRAGECAERILLARQRSYNVSRGDARAPTAKALIAVLRRLGDREAEAGDFPSAMTYCRRAAAVAATNRLPEIEEVNAWQARLAILERVQRQIAAAGARLQERPDDTVAREELVRLHLVEKDDPATASQYAAAGADEAMKSRLAMAAGDSKHLSEGACLDLAEWYWGLAEKASAVAKPAMLRRSCVYYQRFLELHPDKDLLGVRAGLGLQRVQAEVARMTLTVTGVWLDVLGRIGAQVQDTKGVWKLDAGELKALAGSKSAWLDLPVEPVGSYELKVGFQRVDGEGSLAFVLPVGSTSVALRLSVADGGYSGLHAIGGMGADRNPTTVRPGKFSNDRQHTVWVKVTIEGDGADINVTFDEKPYIHWNGDQGRLTAGSLGSARKGRLRLGAYKADVVYSQVQIRLLDERATLQ